MKDYEERTRPSGSKYYVCNYCIKVAYMTATESEMQRHISAMHRGQVD